MTAEDTQRLADLVFEGGGVKGIGLAGAYRELSDHGYLPGSVAGTSAGAITAALVAVGYTGAELQEIVLNEMHFQDFEDPTFLDPFGAPGHRPGSARDRRGGADEHVDSRVLRTGDDPKSAHEGRAHDRRRRPALALSGVVIRHCRGHRPAVSDLRDAARGAQPAGAPTPHHRGLGAGGQNRLWRRLPQGDRRNDDAGP